jgi:hypothetical protein
MPATVEARSPYDDACDNDPLEHEPSIRAMIYAGGRPCRRSQFPDDTSVVILVEGDTIAAFGWMGGTYFDRRSRLPFKVGEPIDRAIAQWGKPAATFDLQTMHIARFGNGIRVMSGRFDQIIGFALGDLPDDPKSDRWRSFDHLYGAYTTHVGNPAVSADECRKVAARLYELAGSKGPIAESDVADCRANNTPEMNRCILAAKPDAVSACFKP